MRTFVLLLLLCCCLAESKLSLSIPETEVQRAFSEWTRQHGKSYNHYEFQMRWQIWRENYFWIEEFNSNASASHQVAMNQYGDLSSQEFARIYKGLTYEHSERNASTISFTDLFSGEIADSWDWREKGAVTHVKNQGQCGSCYSFSATGAAEGAHFLANQELVSLSEQNIVDCSHAFGNNGCNGGLMDSSFKYIIQNGGIDTEKSYPYTAQVGSCRYSSGSVGAKLSSYKDVPQGNEKALLLAIAKQPVSVGIDANHKSFQFYSSGVYYEPSCSSLRLDHGVLLVGWGQLSGQDYWLVKNSWGESWGQKGYVMMARNKNNHCGIATAASYPIP